MISQSRSKLSKFEGVLILLLGFCPLLGITAYQWDLEGIYFMITLSLLTLGLLINVYRRVDPIELSDGFDGTLQRLQGKALQHDEHAVLCGIKVLLTLLELQSKRAALQKPQWLATYWTKPSGGLETLLKSTLIHKNNAKLLTDSLKLCLELLMKHPSIDRKDLWTETNINYLFSIIKNPSKSIDVAKSTCLIIGAIARDDKDMQDRLTPGVIDVLQGIMKTHLKTAIVQQWALLALFQVCQSNNENKVALLKSKTLSTVLQVMEMHGTALEVQRLGCLSIYVCFINVEESFKKTAVAFAISIGMVPIVQAALAEFPEEKRVTDLGKMLLRFAAISSSRPTFEELE